WARAAPVLDHRGGDYGRGAVAGRAGPAGAGPAERAVRQGGARPDARPPGRQLPGCPAGGAPAADARTHRPQRSEERRVGEEGEGVRPVVLRFCGPGRRRYWITEAGITDVEGWLAEPAPPEPDLQSELFAKVVLALMLGRPADSYLDVQRAAHLQRMRELTDL